MPDDSPPMVSVVLPVRDQARYVAAAVYSILNQSYGHLEVLVLDDASMDGSHRVVQELAAGDPRVCLRRHEEALGVARTCQEGLRLASGMFVARMDADDIAHPRRLEQQVAFLRRHPDVAVVGGAVRIIGAEGAVVSQRVSYPETDAAIKQVLQRANPLVHPTTLARRHLLLEVGGYRPQLEGAEDLDLWLRLSERYQLANLPEVVLDYRIHGGQVSSRRMCHQVLAVSGARLSASLRQEGRRDIFDDPTTRINGPWLLAHDFTERELAERLVEYAQWRARAMAEVGEFGAAGRVWREAVRVARDILPDRRLRKEFRRAAANQLKAWGRRAGSGIVRRVRKRNP